MCRPGCGTPSRNMLVRKPALTIGGLKVNLGGQVPQEEFIMSRSSICCLPLRRTTLRYEIPEEVFTALKSGPTRSAVRPSVMGGRSGPHTSSDAPYHGPDLGVPESPWADIRASSGRCCESSVILL